MSTVKPLLAFFGATGGCAKVTLALALKDGYEVVALVRTPSKLIELMTVTHGVPQSIIDANLQIIAGDSKDLAAVKSVLSHNPDRIISGLGGTGKMQASLTAPITLSDPTICADSANTILTALRELAAEGKLVTAPLFVAISTTGVSDVNDVPLAMYSTYHWLLKVPHEDKKAMEKLIAKATTETNAPIRGFVLIRPTWLVDNEEKGPEKLKVGWERHPDAVAGGAKGPGPAKGYGVGRVDVGTWIFQNAINGREDWTNRCVSLAY